MIGLQKGGTSSRKSVQLELKRGKVLVHDLPGMNLGSKIHSALGLDEDVVVVIEDEGSTTSPSQVPVPDKRSERSPTPDFEEEVLFG